MRKGMTEIMLASAIIDKIIKEPIPDYTKEEAMFLLKGLNVMDEIGEFIEEFKPYIIDSIDENK